MTNEDVKEFLRRYGHIKKLIKVYELEIEEFRTAKMNPSLVYDDMPHAHDTKDLSDYMARLDAMITKLQESQNQATEILSETVDTINMLTDASERDVLFQRYIMSKQWEDVAKEVGYSWKQTHRIHGNALMNLKEILEGAE